MKKVLLVIVLMFVSALAHAVACPAGYTATYAINVPAQGSLSGNVSNVPVEFVGNPLLKTVANGGFVQSSTGLDVVFCDAASSGNVVPYELVPNTYSPTTGAGKWFIQFATISKTVTQTVYAMVGTGSPVDKSCGPSGTNNCGSTLWANYLQVHHYGTSSSLSLTDSTGNCTATNHGATAVADNNGFGAALLVLASSQYIDTGCTSNATTPGSVSHLTWLKPTTLSASTSGERLLSNLSGSPFNGCTLIAQAAGAGVPNGVGLACGNNTASIIEAVTNPIGAMTAGTWAFLATTNSGTAPAGTKLYFNGALTAAGFTTGSGTVSSSSTNMTIGGSIATTCVDGALAESWIYNGTLSADYIAAVYASTGSPTSFSSFTRTGAAATFYVSSAGSDSNNCTTTGTPCLTLAHVCPQIGIPGDQVMLRGTDNFAGPCLLSLGTSGSATAPIIIGSYGTTNCNQSNPANCPTITGASGSFATCISSWTGSSLSSTGTCDGIKATNAEYLQIRDINITNTAWSGTFPLLTINNFGFAISLPSTRTAGTQLRGITIGPNVSISNFAFGVVAESLASSSTLGWNGLKVAYNNFTHQLYGSIGIYGYGQAAGGAVNINSNVYIGHNIINDMPGNPNGRSSGNAAASQAINIASTTGATAEFNYVNEGGYTGGTTLGTGGCSIVATNSRSILFQYNEVTRSSMVHNFDGCALDFDQDVQNSVARYNLSYNNPGPFFQMGTFGGKSTINNAIYGNISVNDVRGYSAGTNLGAIELWGGATATSWFYNNTIYVDSSGSIGGPTAIGYELSVTSGQIFANNIFKTTSGIAMIRDGSGYGATGNQYIDNVYDSSGGALTIYPGTSTLAAFRALGSGNENLNNVNYGTVGASNFSNIAGFSPPSTGYSSQPAGISGMSNFDLLAGSAAISAGADPSFLGALIGPVDFHRSFSLHEGLIDAGAVSSVQQSSSSGSGPGSTIIQ
jgi:hypothetical protein